MEKLLKKEMGMKTSSKVGMAIGLVLVLIVSVAFCAQMYAITSRIEEQQAIRSIENISELNKDSVIRAIENRRTFLSIVAARLERLRLEDVDEILAELAEYQNYYDLYHIGVVTKDGVLHLTSGFADHMKGDYYTKTIWDGRFHLSSSYLPYDHGPYHVNAFTQPVFYGGEMRFVLLATYYSKNLTVRMNLSSMEGAGYNFLMDTSGRAVIYPWQYNLPEYRDFMEYIDETPEIAPGDGSDMRFEYNGEYYYAHFEPLGINSWYLMTAARESQVFANARMVTSMSRMAVLLLWLILIIALVWAFASSYRTRSERIKTSFYDTLIGIPNTNALALTFEHMPVPLPDYTYLVALDVDKFKEFNYIYGTEEGDKLLKYIAESIKEVFKDVYLYRYGSDNFVFIVRYDNNAAIEERLRALEMRFDEDMDEGRVQPFDFSAGVRMLNEGDAMRLAVSDAMIAREEIKGNHLKHFAFYDGAVRDRRLTYMNIEIEFPAALRRHEFKVYYQPKFNMVTGKVMGAEALARWIKPNGTVISPAHFIPCLEDSRQITQLDEAILKEVCRYMREMQEEGIDIKPISVNLSRIHLRNPGILPHIAEIVRESGVDPGRLAFEITESALLEDDIPLREIVDFLHELGCRVDMDDYGVGVSGPNALAKNDFDMVKLDKSFVDGLGNRRVEEVIRSTVMLADKLDMIVLAEGVEEREQAKVLMDLGCVYAQGYLYSRPLPAEQYRELLRAGRMT